MLGNYVMDGHPLADISRMSDRHVLRRKLDDLLAGKRQADLLECTCSITRSSVGQPQLL